MRFANFSFPFALLYSRTLTSAIVHRSILLVDMNIQTLKNKEIVCNPKRSKVSCIIVLSDEQMKRKCLWKFNYMEWSTVVELNGIVYESLTN